MSKAAVQQSTNTIGRVVDLLVEHRIRLDALEQVLKETNPLVHELYIGTIENLRIQKAEELNRELTMALKSEPDAKASAGRVFGYGESQSTGADSDTSLGKVK